MKSIRYYLVVALLAAVTLANFVAAVHGYRSSMHEAQALMDAHLADFATLIQTMRPTSSAQVNQPSNRIAFQIWTADGELLQRSTNSGATSITRFESGYRDENFAGFRWRVLARIDERHRRWILVAERIDIRAELADNISLQAVLPIIFSLPVFAIIVWLVVGNGLSLIRKLASELRIKRADDLTRLDTVNPPVELAPVVDAINDLLRRLDESVKRERRFSSDAAHELRTPLSALKVHVHNLQKDCPDIAEELRVLDADLGKLSHLIEQIMLLYRTTPEHYQANMQEIDLHTLAQSVVAELYRDVDSKHQTISLTGTSQRMLGDKASLNILLRNLVLNASKYSPEGASIQVNVDRAKLGVTLSVADTGPGIPLNETDRVFDRFYRLGSDRHSSTAEGCGLGLSIVKHIVELHQANISLENNVDGPGLGVHIVFPFNIEAPMFVGSRSV